MKTIIKYANRKLYSKELSKYITLDTVVEDVFNRVEFRVIEKMTAELGLDIRIVGVPIVRAATGLALSSRNNYLSDPQIRIAASLYGTLTAVAGRMEPGIDIAAQCAWGRQALLDAGFDSVDYFEIRDAATLTLADAYGPGLRVFAAAWIGKTRLIDNLPAGAPR